MRVYFIELSIFLLFSAGGCRFSSNYIADRFYLNEVNVKSFKITFKIVSFSLRYKVTIIKTTNKKEISNGFAKFFSTAAQKLRESICPLITNTIWGCSTIDKYSKFNRFKFKQVSIAEVKKHLKEKRQRVQTTFQLDF